MPIIGEYVQYSPKSTKNARIMEITEKRLFPPNAVRTANVPDNVEILQL